MTAIFRRELRSYLKSGFGWGLMALYLLGFGIFFTVFNLVGGDSGFSYPVSYIQPVLILLIPLLTMRALAEEREKGTEEMLFALPVSTMGLVLGKYFAVVTIFLIPTAVCGCYPLLLSLFGDLSLGTAYTALLGLLLLGCALIAFCLFLSALCKTRVVAFLVGLGSILFVYFFNVFADLLGGVPFLSDLLFGLNPFSKANALLYGQLDLSAVGYLLVLTAVFLFFTVLLVKSRRGFGILRKGAGAALGAVALAIAVGLQFLLGLIPYTASRVNVSGEKVFEVTRETGEWLGTVGEDVTLYFLSDGGVSHASQDLYGYLLSYAEHSPRVTVKVINPRVDTEFMKKHPGASEMSNYSLVVESGRRYKMIDRYDIYYYFNSYIGLSMSAYEYMTYLSAVQSGNTQSEY
jgi:ABC-2 type transport system permease protein